MPSTLRIELTKLDFDWANGEVVLQEGDARKGLRKPRRVPPADPEMDKKFSNGHTSIDLPRAVASDQRFLYLPYKDEHGAGFTRVARCVRDYVNGSAGALPYPT